MDFQYSVKVVCGVIRNRTHGPLSPGQYFTAINIHNPSRCDTVDFGWKVAVGLPGLNIGTVTPFEEASLDPDEALEIDCSDIIAHLRRASGSSPGFVKGWVVIETKGQLDVVAVYSASKSMGQPLETFSMERVAPRCLPPCGDFGLDITTGVAAWQVALPQDPFTLAAITQPSTAWATLPNALWITLAGREDVNVDFTYQLEFRLCRGFRNPNLSLQILADNWAVVLLNGNTIGTTAGTSGTVIPFQQPASLSTNSFFKAGLNVITVLVTNEEKVTGLTIEGFIDVENGACLGAPMPLLTCPGTCYQAHVAGKGWLDSVCNGATAGTTGEKRQMEAMIINLTGAPPGTTIEYQGHLASIGWTAWTPEGQVCGTINQTRQMEAIKIRLVNAPLNCHVQYRVHMKNLGWSSWCSDGQQAGTTAQSRRIEAMEVRIV